MTQLLGSAKKKHNILKHTAPEALKVKDESWFYIQLYALFLAIGFALTTFIPKGDLELAVNANHQPLADTFFKYVTNLGDGLILAFAAMALLFIRYYYAFVLVIISSVHGILIHLFKKVWFPGTLRPKAFFEDLADLHFVEGVKVHSHNTFPSGHTATIFALTVFLALIINKKSWSLALILVAVLVGFSRVYLMQHFFFDVYVGSMVGVLSTWLSVYLVERFTNFTENSLMSRSILRRSF
ncbi:phosphoesterase PA-phosphatase related [Chloroherpeton thalassium ATCC 35110]|uniref:Phosphoesterase PA-phosphatase related n=1 Tax=Chloroherpeton thalassium (strain ATCC 35110 / GB-78) TaxID=517418 RepID=B3QVS7_CHLT3|nr:phosphatase PAP2 family protein [Chloroherpeton thalassium]ACF13134.1 phosphoesterase PA-phosphatase related [Chloroherpeton thalassium ATCC 35110]